MKSGTLGTLPLFWWFNVKEAMPPGPIRVVLQYFRYPSQIWDNGNMKLCLNFIDRGIKFDNTDLNTEVFIYNF